MQSAVMVSLHANSPVLDTAEAGLPIGIQRRGKHVALIESNRL